MFPNAIKFQFPNANFDCFLTVVNASQFRDWQQNGQLIVEHLKQETRGRRRIISKYDRPRAAKRIARIQRFLSQVQPRSVLPPILPQSVVLNVRKRFPERRRGSLYVLPQNLRFHVIDGQHRIWGAMAALRGVDVPLPVTITTGLNEMEEGALFLLINHTQKSVPATIRLLAISVMRRRPQMKNYDLRPLLRALGFKDAEIRTLDIATDQVRDGRHFWFDKIKLPTTEED